MNEDFLNAIIRMDLNRVSELLERDGSLANIPMDMDFGRDFLVLADANNDAFSIYQCFPLHCAVNRGNTELVKLLLRYHADVHVRDQLPLDFRCYGGSSTPLHGARTPEVALLLLDHGADVNCRNVAWMTPLGIAITSQDLDLAKVYIEHGADVNAPCGKDGLAYIHEATVSNQLAMMELLLDGGADVNARTKAFGRTPLHCMCDDLVPEHGYITTVETARLLLRRGADINATDYDGQSVFFSACETDRLDIAQLLFDHGADIRLDGSLALLRAAEHNMVETLRFLLTCGIDVNCRAPDSDMIPAHLHGCTPIVWAAAKDRWAAVRILVDHGADVNTAEPLEGRTPLAMACMQNNVDMTELLLAAGAQVHYKRLDGSTSLMCCVQQGHVECATLLLQRGGDIHATNLQGETPFLFACQSGALDLIYLMLRHTPHHRRPQLWLFV